MQIDTIHAVEASGARNGHRDGIKLNGFSHAKGAKENLTAGDLYQQCLTATPAFGAPWFSIVDTASRLGIAVLLFYRFLLVQPVALLRFALAWNTLWYGQVRGLLLTCWLPVLPFVLMSAELVKRAGEMMPWAETDWKMKGPGRVFFTRPDSLLASLLWDFYLSLSVFGGSFLQYGNDPDGLMHTWYDTICVKEYWLKLLDKAGARRPLQLARWDGSTAHDVGPGVTFGSANLVCKISDSYLGIGDKVLVRGEDFTSLADIQAILAADPEYEGKQAVLSEFVQPDTKIRLSSDGYGSVHSLDIVTMRTRAGVKVLTCLLWTDCTEWSSHSCQAGYLVDIDSETIVSPAAWYSPYFATMPAPLIGQHLPGVREACRKAVAAHEHSDLPWLTTVGWDALIAKDGIIFFEGNVAAYRTPRRMFLTPSLLASFVHECRGKGSPVPQS